MDIKTTKLELMQLLLGTKKEHVLRRIREVFVQEGAIESVDEIDLDQYNSELDKADSAIDRGEFLTQEEVEKKSKEW